MSVRQRIIDGVEGDFFPLTCFIVLLVAHLDGVEIHLADVMEKGDEGDSLLRIVHTVELFGAGT